MDQINRWRKPPAGGQGSQDGVAQPVMPPQNPQNPQNPWSAQNGSAPHGGESGESLDPPWERDSGLWPLPPEARQQQPDDAMLNNPYMDPLLERSLPSMSQDYTGTGKISALPPLRAGSSWNRGVRVPRPGSADASAARSPSVSAALAARSGVEVDEQPSMHIAAMRSSTLLRATTIVSAALLISRIFGMLRTSLFAAAFAYGAKTDAYTLAFTLPDAIFNIVAGGALASAIIPVFNDYIVRRKDREMAWRVASMALNTAMIALVAFCIIAIIFTEPIMRLMFSDIFANCGPEGCYGPLAIQLTRIMLIQPIFLGGATVMISLLQARQSFIAPAIGQVVYTVTVVGGIGATLLDKRYGIFGGNLDIYGPTWGVVIGAVFQFLIQIPGLIKAKMHYTPAVSVTHPGIIEIARLMGPRVLNSAVLYSSVFINRFLLTGLAAAGVLTGYQTAFSLIQLPNGVIGMALAQAAFPTLSTLVSAGEWDRLRQNVLNAIQAILFLAIPSSLGLIVFARPISRALLDYHNFDPSKLPTVYEPLIFFAIGLTGLSLVEILTRSFYALENTRTPTQVSILQFMFVIGMSILLEPWGASGIALASSIAWLGEALVMLLLLRQEMAGLDLKELSVFTIKVLAASALAVLAAAVVYLATNYVLPTAGPHSIVEMLKLILRLAIAVVIGVTIYFVGARFLHIDSVLPVGRLFKRVFRRGR